MNTSVRVYRVNPVHKEPCLQNKANVKIDKIVLIQ
jgi:hypothetical protein